MIIDTLVVVVCLMADTPRTQEAQQLPVGRFTEQFQRADSTFEAASHEAMKSAIRKTRIERHRALGIISYEDYLFLKQGEKELDVMKELKRKTVKYD